MGVFATRSTHRPNPLGLSVVKLAGIRQEKGQVWLDLAGIDLLDGTPVVDIKPYLPWADSVEQATSGFAPEPPENHPVTFTDQALQQCHRYQQQSGHPFKQLIMEVLSQDPRPAYLRKRPRSEYGVRLWDCNIRWQVTDSGFEVFSVEREDG